MKNSTFNRRRIAIIAIFLTVMAGTSAFAMFNTAPKFEAQSGGGRLLVSIFGGGSIYAIDSDPNVGMQSFDMVTNYPGNSAGHPSVATNGMIAFSYRGTGEDSHRVWAMDADGSNRRQLTFNRAVPTTDASPIISPDGTMVAFISNRTTGDIGLQLFIVNTDGTNLRQITPTDVENCGSNCFAYIEQFAWNGNSNVIVAGAQFYIDPATSQRVLRYGLFNRDINSIGDANPPIKVTGGTAFANSQCLDVVGGYILYGNTNRLFVFDFGGTLVNQVNGTSFNEQLLGPGSARFSPNGSRIGYMSRDNNGSLITMNLDGSGRVTVRSNLGVAALAFWWTKGVAIPTPARLELNPRVMQIPNDGSSATFSPALYDASGNLIFRSARFAVICDATHPCNVPFNPFGGFQFSAFNKINLTNPSTTNNGYVTVCATNIVQACSIVGLNRDINFAEVRSSVSTANTNGAGGPGVFTIRRSSTDMNAPISINFTVGGTAIRDIDYSLDVVGNSIVIPTGQTTFDVKVTPLQAAGNKTVTMGITASPNGNYFTEPNSDTSQINIIDNGPVPAKLLLSSISPNHGGDGGAIVASIRGLNIRPGASVRLTRAGQNDILGQTPAVDSNMASINARFNLIGKAQGVWNVVVTNADNSTAQIDGGFTIEPTQNADVWVDVLGRETVRASHTATDYTVVFGNRGNVDALGVPLFITGIPLNAEVELLFDVAPITDLPSLNPRPDVSQIPNVVQTTNAGKAIPLFIPIVRAGQTGSLRFTIRFSSILTTEDFDITAVTMPPMFKAATQPAGSLVDDIVIVPNLGQDCLTSLAYGALNCAIGFIPGAHCAGAVAGAILQAFQTDLGGLGNTSISKFFNIGQITISAISLVAECGGDLLPGISTYLDVVDCLAGGASVADSCVSFKKRKRIRRVQSFDPNDKSGAIGAGVERFTSGDETLRYMINFENVPTASAPAQTVVVTDQLDTAKLDLATFALSQITFGHTVINVPSDTANYTTEVDLRPAKDLIVRVSALLDQNTGLATWQFDSLDPFTRQPTTDPLAGFLPPNVVGNEGAGSVSFSIHPKAASISGTQIVNSAQIVFDLNPPLNTNEWSNTLDKTAPVSSVQPLAPEQPASTFNVGWLGTDTGSGISDYTLYVSKNGGAFQVAEVYSTATSDLFVGEPNTNYAFYTIARDMTGNVEPPKTVGEAFTHTAAAPAIITGTVTYGNAIPAATRYVSNVLISGAGSPPVSIFTLGPGAGEGTYALSGFGSGSYTVTPTKTGGANSITSFDAAKIAQHVTAVNPLTGNQLVVADTSGNGNVTSFDAGLIAKYVVSSPPFGNTGTWKFNPANRTYASVTSNVNGEDFSALLMGEVSGNWTNSGARAARSSGLERPAAVEIPKLESMSGSAVSIPISIGDATGKGIISYEFVLRYDPLVIQPQSNAVDLDGTVSSNMSIAVNAEQPGVLRVAVYGPMPIDVSGILLNLRFIAVGAPGSATALSFDKMMFNEGEPKISVTSGSVKLSTAAFD